MRSKVKDLCNFLVFDAGSANPSFGREVADNALD